MEEKKEYRYQVILSTDGKLTVMGGADKAEEVGKIYEALLPTFKKMVGEMKANDLQRKGGFGAGGFPKKEKEWTGDKCPKDGGRLYHEVTKTGKDICKCENSRWDYKTKSASGCDFVAWGKNLADAKKQKEAYFAKNRVLGLDDQGAENYSNDDAPAPF